MLNPGQWCRVPQLHDHKYARGTVLLRTGSTQFPGAATLTVSAAWGVGVGAVKLYAKDTAELIAQQVLVNAPETLIVGASDDAAVQALVVGSGTTPESWQGSAATWLWGRIESGVPLVADAGALLATMRAPGPKQHLMFTPHQGEFQRLWDAAELGTLPPSRNEQVATLAEHAETTIVLKGNPTLVSGPDGTVTELPEGTPWLATAGTGDVLAGVLGAATGDEPRCNHGRLPADRGNRVPHARHRGTFRVGALARARHHIWPADHRDGCGASSTRRVSHSGAPPRREARLLTRYRS